MQPTRSHGKERRQRERVSVNPTFLDDRPMIVLKLVKMVTAVVLLAIA
jgi:hypothetical protein